MSRTVVFTSFEDFQRRAPELWVDDVKKILTELLRGVVVRMAELALAITARVPRVRDEQGLWVVHESWFVHVNRRMETDISSPASARAGVATARAGDSAGLANKAFQAPFVDFGRARGSNGRLIGSAAAPRGIRNPVIERIWAEMPKLQEAAIRAAMAKMRAA